METPRFESVAEVRDARRDKGRRRRLEAVSGDLGKFVESFILLEYELMILMAGLGVQYEDIYVVGAAT